MQPDDAVRLFPDVVLELVHGAVRPRPVDAVFLPGVEPERVQLPLERAHVVAAEVRGMEVEGPVAQSEPGLDELHPGVGTHEAVPAEAPVGLERPDGRQRVAARTGR